MTSRPTVTIHGGDGGASSDTATLPLVFKAPIRPDIVQYATLPLKMKDMDFVAVGHYKSWLWTKKE